MEAATPAQPAVTVELEVHRTLYLVRLVTSSANLSPDDCRVRGGGEVGFINSTVVSVFRYQPVSKPSENLFIYFYQRNNLRGGLNAATAEKVIKAHPASSCCFMLVRHPNRIKMSLKTPV